MVLTFNLFVLFLHQWRYREQYEQAKDKFTSVLETPEYEAHKRSKKIGDVSSPVLPINPWRPAVAFNSWMGLY